MRACAVRAGSEALYTTAKSLLEQAETQDPLGSAWDKKLRIHEVQGGKCPLQLQAERDVRCCALGNESAVAGRGGADGEG